MTEPAAAILSQPLDLPCGARLPNRLAKAAMTEGLANPHNHATEALMRLYRLWSEGGAGLLISGNVQIDRKHLEAPGNVAIAGTQSPEALSALRRLAQAGRSAGNHFWMQISHAGRQTPAAVNPSPKAPSAVRVKLPGGQFGMPVALEDFEIRTLISRFAEAARVAQETGFTGVQIHAAHGYLLSEFLSPLANLRKDGWGGSLEGRARFLLEAVARTRAAVGNEFPVSVKLNSADFQRGGFSFEDSQIVAGWLDEAGIDLLEISGGNYEQPRMMKFDGVEPVEDNALPASTREREAYFQKFAPEIRKTVKRARLMVTGGFRSASAMADAIAQDGVDVIGLARPLCVDADAPGRLLRGESETLERWEDRLDLGPLFLGRHSPFRVIRTINGFGTMSWFYVQLRSLAQQGRPHTGMGVLSALIQDQRRVARMAKELAGD